GEFTSPPQILETAIERNDAESVVRLGDVGVSLRRGYEDPPQFIVRLATADGAADAIIVSTVMQDDAQATKVGPRLLDVVEEMQTQEYTLPPDLGYEVVFNEADFIQRKIRSFLINLAEAVGIVIVVALLLAGIRSSMVIAAAVPFVMITAFGIARQFDVALEQMSIASLIIALGLLVDNAVVVSDNARRFMNMGYDREEATARGVEEIMKPTLMGTLTTVFVFLPMAFVLTGAGREYVFSIPAVVSATLLTSWVAAMTYTTIMARYIIRSRGSDADSRHENGHGDRDTASERSRASHGMRRRIAKRLRISLPDRTTMQRHYDRFLHGCLRLKWLTIAIAVLALVGSLLLPIGSQFFPSDQRDQFYIDVWLPEGASINATEALAARVEDLIFELGRSSDATDGDSNLVRHSYVSIGGSGPRFTLGVDPTPPTSNFAQFIVTTADADATADLVDRLTRKVRSEIAGARVIPRKYSLGPPVATPISIRLSGVGVQDPGFADIADLRSYAREIERVLRDTGGTWDHHLSWGNIANEIRVDIDEERANAAGVTNAAVAQTLAAYLTGQVLTTFREGDLEIPVVFRLPIDEQSLDLHPNLLFVEGSEGKTPLSAVADVMLRPANVRIERRDNQRMIEIRARNEEGVLANERLNTAKSEIEAIADELPPGMSIEYGGELEEASEAQVEISTAFGVGFVLLTLVLVIQYNSLVKPLVVLTTLPMGAIGALLGLYLSGQALGFMPMLGLVALAGMVVNAAILYLEFADSRIEDRLRERAGETDQQSDDDEATVAGGLTRDEFRSALAEAGKIRLVPILLTSLTTIGGFVPLLFAGPLWKGLAAVMIGGLATATLLTLIVLPAIYAVVVERLHYKPISRHKLSSAEGQSA
ncbi:MAG: efflux RND transporter permease subunit, partial [Planctomycetota bacterium]